MGACAATITCSMIMIPVAQDVVRHTRVPGSPLPTEPHTWPFMAVTSLFLPNGANGSLLGEWSPEIERPSCFVFFDFIVVASYFDLVTVFHYYCPCWLHGTL